MTVRARIAVLAACAVAVAVVVAAGVAFAVARNELRRGVDASLQRFAIERSPGIGSRIDDGGAFILRADPPADLPELQLVVQFISADGVKQAPLDQPIALPVAAGDVAVARGEKAAFLRDVTVSGKHFRMVTAPAPIAPFRAAGGAIQVARSLGEVDTALRGLGVVLFFVALGGVGIAGALGLGVARSALRPIGKLTEAAENVAATQDLDAPIAVERDDEIGRLASSFNSMLKALKQSRLQQQQLVTDASHELRTPLTSLRTNIEVLSRSDGELDPVERARILADLNSEMRELSNLVAELVDLATVGPSDEEMRDVRLDEVAAEVVERARRRTGQRIDFEGSASVVRARPTQLARAASNVVDNACKFNSIERSSIDTLGVRGAQRPRSNGHAVEVRVDGTRFEVRDYGPGINEDDLPYVFDRFYRSPAARALPGSGLGLAIVKQIVEDHGGHATASNAPDGGAVVAFELPSGQRA
ncbi:MAG TPA: HAMP domain-containing sensor histidine kinase [Actinomycetota bacterium]|jgi:two-component system sensor histidine kinase MprB|nr:HAMP domain-containing sensor histidine kinase [Actinomycetota bacterium]